MSPRCHGQKRHRFGLHTHTDQRPRKRSHSANCRHQRNLWCASWQVEAEMVALPQSLRPILPYPDRSSSDTLACDTLREMGEPSCRSVDSSSSWPRMRPRVPRRCPLSSGTSASRLDRAATGDWRSSSRRIRVRKTGRSGISCRRYPAWPGWNSPLRVSIRSHRRRHPRPPVINRPSRLDAREADSSQPTNRKSSFREVERRSVAAMRTRLTSNLERTRCQDEFGSTRVSTSSRHGGCFCTGG